MFEELFFNLIIMQQFADSFRKCFCAEPQDTGDQFGPGSTDKTQHQVDEDHADGNIENLHSKHVGLPLLSMENEKCYPSASDAEKLSTTSYIPCSNLAIVRASCKYGKGVGFSRMA